MWFGATLTLLSLVLLFWKLGSTFRQLVLGYDIITDILVTSFFVWVFALTGTISGMMIAIVAGLLTSIGLLVAKKLFTSRTLIIHREGLKFHTEYLIRPGLVHILLVPRRQHASSSN